MVKVYTN